MTGTANIFVRKRMKTRSKREFIEEIPVRAKDKSARIKNINSEAPQALKIFFKCRLIEEKDGESKPRASFVVVVEPTTDPTFPIIPIIAG